MIRCIVIAVLAATLAGPGAADAAVSWHGGGALPGIDVDAMVSEADGTLVAIDSTKGVLTSPAEGTPLAKVSNGFELGHPFFLRAVTGGLRVLDDEGGLWHSADHGRTWELHAVLGFDQIGDPGEGEGIVDVAIDAAHPDRVVLVHADGGVQRSVDGGVTLLSAVPLDAPASLVEFDDPPPGSAVFTRDGDLVVLLGNRLWRSPDLGDTWQRLPNAPAGRLVPSPAAAGVLWIDGRSGIFRSDDGGHTWQRRHARAVGLVASPANADVAWSIAHHHTELTVDGGRTWRNLGSTPSLFDPPPAAVLPTGPTSLCIAAAQGIWCSDGGAFAFDAGLLAGTTETPSAFAVDPSVTGHAVAVMTRLVWETTDGGATWHRSDAPLIDYRGVAVTREGTFLSTDHGTRFRARGARRWVRRVGPRGPAAYAFDARSGTLVARAGATLWRSVRGGPFRRLPASGLAADPIGLSVGAGGRTIVAWDNNGLISVSTDGGRTFSTVEKVGNFSVIASHRRRRLLVAAAFDGIRVSTDAGRTWQTRWAGFATAVTADPRHPGRWYAMTAASRVLVSTDDARTWRALAVLPRKGDRGDPSSFPAVFEVGRDRLWTALFGGLVWTRRDVAHR